MNKSALSFHIRQNALAMGFSGISFIPVKSLVDAEKKFLEWRDRGYAADMHYLLRDDPINARPEALLKDARSIIMLTAGYYTPVPPKPGPDWGRVAAYAVGRDYHKVLRKKVQELIDSCNLAQHSRFFTDAVPLLEKSFAVEAGLGFQGRNTLLISPGGSYNFILEIITDLELDYDVNHSNPVSKQACGACTRCIDVCPTEALSLDLPKNTLTTAQEFLRKNQHNGILDARLCISYLTIENRGEIPRELQSKIGDWVFGCDLCQEVCPYNHNFNDANEKAKAKIFKEFWPESGVGHWLHLPSVLELDPAINGLSQEANEAEFYKRFGGTPLARAKLSGLQRNARVVLQNSQILQTA